MRFLTKPVHPKAFPLKNIRFFRCSSVISSSSESNSSALETHPIQVPFKLYTSRARGLALDCIELIRQIFCIHSFARQSLFSAQTQFSSWNTPHLSQCPKTNPKFPYFWRYWPKATCFFLIKALSPKYFENSSISSSSLTSSFIGSPGPLASSSSPCHECYFSRFFNVLTALSTKS